MTAFVRRLARPVLRLAVGSLPLVVLTLSAAPGSCPAGSCNDDLSAPSTAAVVSLP